MLQFKTVQDLTDLNVRLHSKAEAFIEHADKAKSQIAEIRANSEKKYLESDTFAELPKNTRQQMFQAEVRKLTAKISQEFDEASKGMLREIGGLTDQIQASEGMYEPIRRLNWHTASGELAKDRASVQQLLDGASLPEIETLLATYKGSDNLAGIAAVSSVVGRDADMRKKFPNAKILDGVKFGDEDQLDAIFHAGNNMAAVLLDEARSVNGAANGARRINAGLRGMKVEDGKVVDIRPGGAS